MRSLYVSSVNMAVPEIFRVSTIVLRCARRSMCLFISVANTLQQTEHIQYTTLF